MRSYLVLFLTVIIMAFYLQPLTAAEFDIPLSELQKVKKKPAKHTKSYKKRKNTTKSETETSSATAAESSKSGVGESGTVETNISSPNKTDFKTSESSILPSTSKASLDNSSINHSPNSYIIADRRIRVQAVIFADEPVVRVYCYFKAIGSNYGAAVQMSKVDGTRFTYSSVIPALSAKVKGLRYRIYQVDHNGVTIQSPDYEMPMATSNVRPGWQLEHFNDILQLTVDDEQPTLDGFSDPIFPLKKP